MHVMCMSEWSFLFSPQVKLYITRKLIACLILGYLVFHLARFLVYGLSFWLRQQLLADPASYFLYTYLNIYSFTPHNVTVRKLTPSAKKQNDVLLQLSIYVIEFDYKFSNLILYGVILVETIVLIIAFKRSVMERKSLMGDKKSKKPRKSATERKLVLSVLAVCFLYIVLTGPTNLHGALVMPYFGENRASFMDKSWFSFLLVQSDMLNHSLNIFVYLSMNSKFRKIFMHLFCFKRHLKL